MVASILFSLLFIITLSFILIFVFYLLLPSMENQGIKVLNPLFSESEILFEAIQEIKKREPIEKKAIVLCSSFKKTGERRIKYGGPKNCALFFSLFDTEFDCVHNCVGFGDCVKACKKDAIFLEKGCAVVSNICDGCGECVSVCPNNCIRLIPFSQEQKFFCSSTFSETTLCNRGEGEEEDEEKEVSREKKHFKLWEKLYTMFYDGK